MDMGNAIPVHGPTKASKNAKTAGRLKSKRGCLDAGVTGLTSEMRNNVHQFFRTDCYSLMRVVRCSCGYEISGYTWAFIDAEIARHLDNSTASESDNIPTEDQSCA